MILDFATLNAYGNEELALIYKNQDCRLNVKNGFEMYDEYYREERYSKDYYSDSTCFITTAVCNSFGKPDDCRELTAFRNFRDSYMMKDESMKNEVRRYYHIAPKICEVIDNKGKSYAQNTYTDIWNKYLSPAYDAINNNNFEKAHKIYKNMVLELEDRYLV